MITVRGYVYAVCQRGLRHSVKIGFTSLLTVEKYLHDCYSRSLSPLQILLVLPTSNARLAESLIHHTLAEYCLHERHELFDLAAGLELLLQARELVVMADRMANTPLPPERPFCMDRWSLHKVAAKEGRRWEKRRRQVKEANLLKDEREQMLRDKKSLEEEKTMSQQRQARAEDRQRELDTLHKADERKSRVSRFVSNALQKTGDPTDMISRAALYKTFKTMYPAETQRLSQLGKRKWFDELQILLGKDGFCERKRVADKFYRDVWLGWKLEC